MRKYHILYKDKEEDLVAKGAVIEVDGGLGLDDIDAHIKFKEDYPNKIFLGMFTFELAETMYRTLKTN